MKTVELTERELTLLIAALGTHVQELMREPPGGCLPTPMMADLINELHDLEADLSSLNRDDGWPCRANPHMAQAIDNEANERLNDAVPSAAKEFIQAGIDAREAIKALKQRNQQAFGDSDMRLGSMAAQRRAAAERMDAIQRMMQGTATPVIVEDEDS